MLVRSIDYLHEPIVWHKTKDPEYPYETIHEFQKLTIRLNDFPDDHLYTLLADTEPVTSFDDWPEIWIREADDTVDLYSNFMGAVSLTADVSALIDEIGVALIAAAEYLESDSRRDQEFRLLMARVKEVWRESGITNWDEIFFRQAMKHAWPTWAIIELNSLNVRSEVINDQMTRYLIWEIYLPFLEELGVVFDVVSKNGILLEIDASPEAALFLEKTRFTIEEIRVRSPFRRYRSVLGVANQGFMDLELYFRTEGETRLAAAVDEARRTILKMLGLDFPAQSEKQGEIAQAQLVTLLNDFTPQPAIFFGYSG